jgi:hypothetical protein
MGWASLKNGELLRAAEENGIDVLLTGDGTLSYEQNLTGTAGNCGAVDHSATYYQKAFAEDHRRHP